MSNNAFNLNCFSYSFSIFCSNPGHFDAVSGDKPDDAGYYIIGWTSKS